MTVAHGHVVLLCFCLMGGGTAAWMPDTFLSEGANIVFHCSQAAQNTGTVPRRRWHKALGEGEMDPLGPHKHPERRAPAGPSEWPAVLCTCLETHQMRTVLESLLSKWHRPAVSRLWRATQVLTREGLEPAQTGSGQRGCSQNTPRWSHLAL